MNLKKYYLNLVMLIFTKIDLSIILRPPPTKHTIWHEMFHLEHFNLLGKDEYLQLGKLGHEGTIIKEKYVLDRLLDSGLLNEEEILQAYRSFYFAVNKTFSFSDWGVEEIKSALSIK